jgi:hypothetical protein
MNPRELVSHIRSGLTALVLFEPLRFRRRTLFSPCCDFNKFLQALRSSETIQDIRCGSHQKLGITGDEWILLVKTLGRIRDIQHLEFFCAPGARDFHPFQAIAEAVNSAQSLRKLVVDHQCEVFPRDPLALIALANALREHTALETFAWFDFEPLQETVQSATLDPVLWTLSACPHLKEITIITKSASANALKSLLELHSAIDLRLVLNTTENWLAVVDAIRMGRCLLKTLHLGMLHSSLRSKATEAVQALAGAIQMDRNLEHLSLQIEDGFTDVAGVALAKALAINKTLLKITLDDNPVFSDRTLPKPAALGVAAYEALSAMLRVNTSLVLKLPPFETDGANEKLRESRDQLHIEQRWNYAGRGRLLVSTQTTREQWADTLHELNFYNVDDSCAFQVSCLYSLLRLHPAVFVLRVGDYFDSDEWNSR